MTSAEKLLDIVTFFEQADLSARKRRRILRWTLEARQYSPNYDRLAELAISAKTEKSKVKPTKNWCRCSQTRASLEVARNLKLLIWLKAMRVWFHYPKGFPPNQKSRGTINKLRPVEKKTAPLMKRRIKIKISAPARFVRDRRRFFLCRWNLNARCAMTSASVDQSSKTRSCRIHLRRVV